MPSVIVLFLSTFAAISILGIVIHELVRDRSDW